MSITPGPWRRVTGQHEDLLAIFGSNDTEVCNFGNSETYYPTEGKEPSDDDRKLILAAWDLLQAAKHAAMEWRLHGQLTDSCRVLEAAIKKAEGA